MLYVQVNNFSAMFRWFPVFLGQGFYQQIWEKAPGQNWEKMIGIEHNKGSKIKLF